jgi:hypothetical protein
MLIGFSMYAYRIGCCYGMLTGYCYYALLLLCLQDIVTMLTGLVLLLYTCMLIGLAVVTRKMCASMYLSTYVEYTYTHIHTHTYIYIHIHTYMSSAGLFMAIAILNCIHIHTYTFIHTHIHTWVARACSWQSHYAWRWAFLVLHSPMHTYTYIHIHTYTHTYMSSAGLLMAKAPCVEMSYILQCIHIHTYTHTHTHIHE